MNDRRLYAALALSLAAFALGCGRRTDGAPPQRSGPRPIVVRTAAVTPQDVVYEVKALGSLEAEEMVQVTAEVEGAVARVDFHEGQRVGADTVIAHIDPDRYRLELQRAEAAHKRALAEARRAASDLARREELEKEQLVAAEELNRARQDAERLEAEAEAAKAALDWAAQNLARSRVKAPHAGVINTKTVETGQYVKMGAVLATLVDTSRLRLRFKVSEAESLRAVKGQAVAFKVGALGTTEFPATIYHVGEIADPGTRQVEVLAWVRNPGVLKPGFFAEVTLATETRKGALVVPEGAIQASERGFVTYVVEAGKARVRPVQIGLRTGTGVVEIVSGVKAGETVVIEGSDRLADGAAVEPAPGGGPVPAAAKAGS